MALTEQAQALLDMVYRVGAPRFHDLTVYLSGNPRSSAVARAEGSLSLLK